MARFSCSVVLILVLFLPSSTAIFSWLFGHEQTPEESTSAVAKTKRDMALQTLKEVEKSLVNFDFTTEQKFLSDSSRHELEKLSAVDTCHQILVSKLSKSCGRLNEEDIGKLAVQLLNCQLRNEGRETYECSDSMSLKQCTQDMSPTVWNAYQIVGNRARGVCQATKQHQFRIKTEMAVNQLMSSTVGQLRAMEKLNEGQEKLGEAASETIRKMYESQEDLMIKQESLKSSHGEVQEFVAENLKALTREKALIASGNQELAKMTESIRQKLDQATLQLEEQRVSRAENHGEIVSDLALIRNKAKDVWDKIDANTKHLMTYHDQTTDQYQTTLANLERLNSTVSYILTSVQKLKSGIDARFGWLTTLVSGSQEQITVIYIVVLHSGYFILSAILASFLQTELFTRTVILVLVPMNCVAAVKHGVALDFLALSIFVLLLIAAHWFIHVLYACISSVSTPSSPDMKNSKPAPNVHPTPMVPSKIRDPGLSRKDLAKIATALRDVLSERTQRRRHSSSTPLNMSRDSALDASFFNQNDETIFKDGDTPPGCHTPIPHQEATFNPLDATDHVTDTLNQVKAKLMNNVINFEPVKSRSAPQSPSRTPTKGTSFMSLQPASNRIRCSSMTKCGKRCRSYCVQGQDTCRVHSTDVSNATSFASSNGNNSTFVLGRR